jgi:endonuclease/exonuclease/phosphatase family metal-dependent hydrolase
VARLLVLLAPALLLVGCSFLPVDFHPTEADRAEGRFAPPAPAAAESLVVASYNIQYGEDIDLALADLRAEPHLARADLLLLQEMHPDSTALLAEELGYDFVYYPASITPARDRLFGNAVLSRWPIVAAWMVHLPQGGIVYVTRRIAVVAEVDVAGTRVRVVSTHTATVVTARAERMDQARTIARAVSDFGGPVVVGGDFNTVTREDVTHLRNVFRRVGLRHVRLPAGATVRGPRVRLVGGAPQLDHFFVRGAEIVDAGIASGARASDHYPIWTVLRL